MVEKLYNEDADRYIFIDEDNAENLIEVDKHDAEGCDVLVEAMESGNFEKEVEFIIGKNHQYAAIILKGKDEEGEPHTVMADFSDDDVAAEVKEFLIAVYIEE